MNLKFFPLVLIVLLLMGCKSAPVQQIPRYVNDVKDIALNGPVKIYRTFWVDKRNMEFRQEKEYIAMKTAQGKIGSGAQEYDEFGRLIAYYSMQDSLMQPLDSFSADLKYVYHQKDFELKKKYTQPDYPKNTYNPLRLMLNRYVYRKSGNGYTMKLSDSVSVYAIYEYDINKNNAVIQERKYEIWEYADVRKNRKDENYFVNYTYNDQGQLLQRDYDHRQIYDVKIQIDHFYESRRRYKVDEYYTYDEKGRLFTVKMYYNSQLLFMEEYTYDDKDRVTKMRRIKGDDIMVLVKQYKAQQEHFFNERGEAVKIITYNEEGVEPFSDVYATYYFKYSNHDRYDNWLRCEAYLNEEQDGAPYATYERYIEYYPKPEK